MRLETFARCASALFALVTTIEAHKGVHEQLDLIHRRHREHRTREINHTITENTDEIVLQKRGQCAFPTDAGLVAVTPGLLNAGWAMSPDQPCTPGSYCPYACPPGQVSMQWDPKATSYSYPQSMNGGLYCDSNGQISKPFPDKPYCQSTTSNIGVVNNAGSVVSFCQTVLPGNEAMLIPTAVEGSATLAAPGTDYWCGTAAHYYINPPGVGVGEACVWGSSTNPYGNWSPYVAGANVDASGQTFIKLGWNPIYLEQATPFRNTMPNWGVKIDCPNGGCNGLPCAIDPTQNNVNSMMGSASNGAGGGAFCVVTVSKGATANFVITGGNGGGSSSQSPAKGGQFWQSSNAASSSTPTTSSSSSTTKSTTSSSTPSSASTTKTSMAHVWSSSANSTTTTSQPSTWTSYDVATTTATTKSGSTEQSHYSLFEPATTTAAATSSTFVAPSALPARGDAGRYSVPAVGLILAIWTLL